MAEEQLDSWIQEVDAAATTEVTRWSENFVKLVPKSQLETKIMELGDAPLLMCDLINPDGEYIVKKYTQMNKYVWQRLRYREDAPELYFVCENPIRVVEGFNLEFFNYEDYQFLGAYLAESGKSKGGLTLFTEALKSKTADAQINKAVFHFRVGATGVMDNERLAKKHFEKGLEQLLTAHLMPNEIRQRRKVCETGLGEIEYKMSTGLVRLFQNIIRLLTLRFEPDLFYVGPADRAAMRDAERLRTIRDTIANYEMQMLKDAAESFVYSIQANVESVSPDSGLALAGVLNQIHAATAESLLPEYARTIGDIYIGTNQAAARRDKEREEARREANASILDRLTPDDRAAMQRLDSQYQLKSPRELADMAERKDIDRTFVLWAFKERQHIRMIMEALYQNSGVSSDIKQEMERRCAFLKQNRRI